ncbi:hypothetical protein DPM33_23715 [Mesorhizobium hawassense]|uniref:TULIP family P47-like protein n=1 Tax=Mesorhizobium hawassense TaxID=1209954 RepID=A0A330HLR7_9HYPH|nr:hypothetical protein [Mesorhizobium hawassense]RAZ88532.1 hypothetical protein DPM33_23715 [Mesorhizobium hawassense]
MSGLNELSGYDLVYAVSQKTINNQLELLSALSVMPTTWKAADPDGFWSIDLSVGTPTVDAVTGNVGARALNVIFPFTGGTMTYSSLGRDANGKPAVISKTIQMKGWGLKVTVNMSLAEIAQTDIAAHKLIPDAVKRQLKAFTVDMYDIRHLFLNFEDADLITDSYEFIPAAGVKNADLVSPNVITQLRAVVQSVIETLRGSNNPFIFGYAVTNKKVPPKDAMFVPTGSSYSIYAEGSDPGRSSLNFLSQTQGRAVPSDAKSGLFDSNWISSDQVQGTYVIAERLVMELLVPPVAKLFGFQPQDFQQSNNTVTAHKSGKSDKSTTITFTPVANKPQYSCQIRVAFKVDAKDMAGSYIGYADVEMFWNADFLFGLDGGNNLTLNLVNSKTSNNIHKHPNSLGEFEQVISMIADTAMSAISDNKVNGIFHNMESQAWPKGIAAPLEASGLNLKSRIILAAGSEFFFKDIATTPQGHLKMTTTIKN